MYGRNMRKIIVDKQYEKKNKKEISKQFYKNL